MTAQPPVNNFALWNLGFRPFYLLAQSVQRASASCCGPCNSRATCLPSYLQGPVWHGHEMLFGYTIAVIAGSC